MAANSTSAPSAVPEVLWKLCSYLNERRRLLEQLEQVAHCAAELTATDHADITLFDSTLRRFIPLRSTLVFIHQGEPDAAARVRDGKRTVLVPDLNFAASDEDLALFNRDVASYLAVPVMNGARVDAALVVFNREARNYDQGEQQALEGLAALAAVALKQKRLTLGLEDATRTLLKLSLTDPHTGIATRQQFDQMLQHEWRKALGEGLSISLIQLEIDGLGARSNGAQNGGSNSASNSAVNDSANNRSPGEDAGPGDTVNDIPANGNGAEASGGSEQGHGIDKNYGVAKNYGAEQYGGAEQIDDDVRQELVRTTRTLRAALYRAGDMIALLSDYRLAIILPDTDLAGAGAIARRLQRDVAAASLGEDGPPMTLSIGISSFDSLQLQQGISGTPEKLFRYSASALERAKKGGGNQSQMLELAD
ncbi:MAG: diguanylate cyclase [Trueperaceae bacterium]